MDPQPREMTVGELVDLLSECDRDAPARLAINPFFPMAHRLGDVIATVDEHSVLLAPVVSAVRRATRM